MFELKLKDYGQEIKNYTIIFDAENKIDYFISISETDSNKIVYHKSLNNDNLIMISNSLYTRQITNNKFIDSSFILHDLDRKLDSPIVVNYDNCNGEKLDNYYYHFIEVRKNKLNFIFDRDEIAFFENHKCTVYKGINGEILDQKPIKYIYFTSMYIVTKDLLSDTITYEGIKNKLYYEFKLFTHKQDYKHSILSSLPTSIVGEDNIELFYIGYDDQGIVKSMIDKKDNIDYICRYEATESERVSIHPLIYDAFDYKYINAPYVYFAFDYLTLENYEGNKKVKNKVLQRYIYKIDKKELLLKMMKMVSEEYKDKFVISLYD